MSLAETLFAVQLSAMTLSSALATFNQYKAVKTLPCWKSYRYLITETRGVRYDRVVERELKPKDHFEFFSLMYGYSTLFWPIMLPREMISTYALLTGKFKEIPKEELEQEEKDEDHDA